MKTKKLKNMLISVLAVVLVLCSVLPTAFAATQSAYQSADYSIQQGGTWEGKKTGDLWYVDSQETRFNVSILSTSTKTVTAVLYKVRAYLPDYPEVSLSLTGSNGTWKPSEYMILDHQHAYYATVHTNSSGGATGRVSIQSHD